jgi:hypothetical protein
MSAPAPIDGRWLPLPMSAGVDCEVGCGLPARWARRARHRNVESLPVVARLYRCDEHVPAAPFGSRGCPHRPGPCRTCQHLNQLEPLSRLDPYKRHQLLSCPEEKPA